MLTSSENSRLMPGHFTEMFAVALCGLCLSKISGIILERCGALDLGHRTVSLIKMDFYIETCGRIFLSSVRMLVSFYKGCNGLKKILSKVLSNQEASREFWRHLLPLTVAGTKIKAALGNSGLKLLVFPLNWAGG